MRKGQKQSEEAKAKLRAAALKQAHPTGITREMVAEEKLKGNQRCSGKCKAFLPSDRFSSEKSSLCKKCVAEHVQGWRDKQTKDVREKMAAYFRDWRAKNPDYERDYRLDAKYGVTVDWYEEKLAKQCGVCEICGGGLTEGRKYFCVDHDHKTGEARGLLCLACNWALAHIETPGKHGYKITCPDWQKLAAGYLKKYGTTVP